MTKCIPEVLTDTTIMGPVKKFFILSLTITDSSYSQITEQSEISQQVTSWASVSEVTLALKRNYFIVIFYITFKKQYTRDIERVFLASYFIHYYALVAHYRSIIENLSRFLTTDIIVYLCSVLWQNQLAQNQISFKNMLLPKEQR